MGRTLAVVAAILVAFAGGAVGMKLLSSPGPTPTPAPTITLEPTPDLSADYLEKVSLDWQALEKAWSGEIDRGNLLGEGNMQIIDARKVSLANARHLDLTLRSLYPPPERAALLHQELSDFVQTVIAWGDADQKYSDNPPFGLFGDSPHGVENRTAAMNEQQAALSRINELLPQIRTEFEALSGT